MQFLVPDIVLYRRIQVRACRKIAAALLTITALPGFNDILKQLQGECSDAATD